MRNLFLKNIYISKKNKKCKYPLKYCKHLFLAIDIEVNKNFQQTNQFCHKAIRIIKILAKYCLILRFSKDISLQLKMT